MSWSKVHAEPQRRASRLLLRYGYPATEECDIVNGCTEFACNSTLYIFCLCSLLSTSWAFVDAMGTEYQCSVLGFEPLCRLRLRFGCAGQSTITWSPSPVHPQHPNSFTNNDFQFLARGQAIFQLRTQYYY